MPNHFIGHMYENWFSNSWGVAKYVKSHLDVLGKETEKWQAIFEFTKQAELLIAEALDCEDLKPQHRDETHRLYMCLQVGKRFAEISVKVFQKQDFAAEISRLRDFIADNFESTPFVPGNGEYELWSTYIDNILKFVDKTKD